MSTSTKVIKKKSGRSKAEEIVETIEPTDLVKIVTPHTVEHIMDLTTLSKSHPEHGRIVEAAFCEMR